MSADTLAEEVGVVCASNLEAAERAVAALGFAGDTVMVTTEQLVAALG
jgi:hypothetical protein